MTGASHNRHRSEQTVCTPPEMIEAVERRFGRIEFDLAADEENSICRENFPGAFYDEGDGALERDWPWLLCWLNPPFALAGKFAAKAAYESQNRTRVIMLVPASVSTNWYRDHVDRKALCIPIKRVRFVGHKADFPKDMMLVLYGFGVTGWAKFWDWKND